MLTSAAVGATVLVTPVGAAVADPGSPTTQPRLVRVELSPEGSGAGSGTLPVTVSVQYRLDGRLVTPHELVGRSGHLQVTYHVQNASAHPTLVSYRGTDGREMTKSVSVVTPYVGRLTTTLPSSTRHLTAPRAQIPELGRGNRVAWSMALFSPLGSARQSFGWSADVHDATLPVVDVRLLPVTSGPENHLAARSAGRTVASGHEVGGRLRLLRDGARKLLDGLTRLNAAAVRLQHGLRTQAVPRARHLTHRLNRALTLRAHVLASELGAALKPGTGLAQGVHGLGADADRLARRLHTAHLAAEDLARQAAGLASTAVRASNGAQQLTDGAQGLSDGANQAASTAGQVSANGRQVASAASSAYADSQDFAADLTALSTGLAQIAAGLDQLTDAGTGLPAAASSAKSLEATIAEVQVGVDQALATIGDTGTANTILGQLAASTGTLSELGDASTGLPAAKSGVDQVQQDLASAAADGGAVDQLEQHVAGAQMSLSLYLENASCNPGPPCDELNDVASNLNGLSLDPLKAQFQGDADQLAATSTGLGTAVAEVATLQTALSQVTGGVIQTEQTLSSGDPASPGVKEGLAEASTGVQQLVAELDDAVTMATGLETTAHPTTSTAQRLGPGVTDLVTALGTLSGGASSVASGANDLATGATGLVDGAQTLVGGAARVTGDTHMAAEGAHDLAGKAGSLSRAVGRSETPSQNLSTGIDAAGSRAADLARQIDRSARGSRHLAAHVHRAAIWSGQVRRRTHTMVQDSRRLQYATLLALGKRGTRSVAYEYTLTAAADAGPGATGWFGVGLLAGGALLMALAGRRFRRVRPHG